MKNKNNIDHSLLFKNGICVTAVDKKLCDVCDSDV